MSDDRDLPQGFVIDWERRAKEAEAKVDRLREALEAVKEMLETFYDPHVHYKHESWDQDQRPFPLSKAILDIRQALQDKSND